VNKKIVAVDDNDLFYDDAMDNIEEEMMSVSETLSTIPMSSKDSFNEIEDLEMMKLEEEMMNVSETISTIPMLSRDSKTHMRPLDSFIILQTAHGYFMLNHDFEAAVSLSREDIQNNLPTEISSLQGLDDQTKLTLWVTIIALAYLEKSFSDMEDEWLLLADKSQKYIKKTLLGNPLNIQQLKETAKILIL